jgi:hypothetical protein
MTTFVGPRGLNERGVVGPTRADPFLACFPLTIDESSCYAVDRGRKTDADAGRDEVPDSVERPDGQGG